MSFPMSENSECYNLHYLIVGEVCAERVVGPLLDLGYLFWVTGRASERHHRARCDRQHFQKPNRPTSTIWWLVATPSLAEIAEGG